MRKKCANGSESCWIRWLPAKFGYAFEGLVFAFSKDRSVRTQLFLAFIAIIAGILVKLNMDEWLWLFLCVALVLSAELVNSAIEQTVDYISEKYSRQAKIIKDLSAASVLVVSVFALIVGIFIFVPRIYHWFY